LANLLPLVDRLWPSSSRTTCGRRSCCGRRSDRRWRLEPWRQWTSARSTSKAASSATRSR